MSSDAVSYPTLPFLAFFFFSFFLFRQAYFPIFHHTVYLMETIFSETAVASGAVLCALNRKDGPTRVIGSSYGFLCTEIYEPDIIEAHRTLRRPRIDRLDGERYVRNTIRWIVKKVRAA
jgi:hypothetical protein